MTLRTLLLAICGLSLFSVEASASIVKWELHDVTFSDGGTATGSFFYYVDSNTYSAIRITTTAGSARSGATYLHAYPSSDRFHGLFVTVPYEDQKGLPGLYLTYANPLTNRGGHVPLAAGFGIEMTCANASCTVFGTPQRIVTGGYLAGYPIEFDSTSSMGSHIASSDNLVAAALPGGFGIEAQVPSSQHPLPASFPSWITLEAYLRPAMPDSRD